MYKTTVRYDFDLHNNYLLNHIVNTKFLLDSKQIPKEDRVLLVTKDEMELIQSWCEEQEVKHIFGFELEVINETKTI